MWFHPVWVPNHVLLQWVTCWSEGEPFSAHPQPVGPKEWREVASWTPSTEERNVTSVSQQALAAMTSGSTTILRWLFSPTRLKGFGGKASKMTRRLQLLSTLKPCFKFDPFHSTFLMVLLDRWFSRHQTTEVKIGRCKLITNQRSKKRSRTLPTSTGHLHFIMNFLWNHWPIFD